MNSSKISKHMQAEIFEGKVAELIEEYSIEIGYSHILLSLESLIGNIECDNAEPTHMD